jgi:hypothetical protein
MMNQTEAYGQLYQAGFRGTEIDRLLQLREQYEAEKTQREVPLILRRLEFIRWLVRTGRLTEQTVREEELIKEREVFSQPLYHL